MAAIHSRDTKPEMVVRRWLWRHGYRYRLNHPRLPGRPDIVMRKYRTCIFVNGCFWHGHRVNLQFDNLQFDNLQFDNLAAPDGGNEGIFNPLSIVNSVCCKIPMTNREFWVRKIRRNQERDREVQRRLAEMGWHSITVWECELKSNVRERTLQSLAFTLNQIFLQDHGVRHIRYEAQEEEEEMLMAAEEAPEYN